MENINGVIYKDISIDKNISTKRVICVNVANATCGGLYISKYSGRRWASY